MTPLPIISARDCIKALQRAGFIIRRQNGSHIVLTQDELTVVVPNHKEIKRSTLKNILRQAQLSIDELLTLLNS